MSGTETSPTDPDRNRAVSATAWFSVLMHAQLANNFKQAAEAQGVLEGLGVSVRLKRRPTRKPVPA